MLKNAKSSRGISGWEKSNQDRNLQKQETLPNEMITRDTTSNSAFGTKFKYKGHNTWTKIGNHRRQQLTGNISVAQPLGDFHCTNNLVGVAINFVIIGTTFMVVAIRQLQHFIGQHAFVKIHDRCVVKVIVGA